MDGPRKSRPAPFLTLSTEDAEPGARYLIWRDQEDDRLGFAIAITLSNPRLTQDDALAWLDPIEEAFLHGEPGPVPAFASNSIRTLRVVCLLATEQMHYQGQDVRIQHSSAVGQRLREVLHIASPWMWNLET